MRPARKRTAGSAGRPTPAAAQPAAAQGGSWAGLLSAGAALTPLPEAADPALAWAQATGFRDFRPADARLTVLIELAPGQAVADLRQWLGAEDPPAVPAAYPPEATHCAARLTPERVAALQALPALVGRLELSMPVVPQRPAPQPVPAASSAAMATPLSTAGPVLIGLIDSGCPFAHVALRRAGTALPSTRLLALWDQDDTSPLQGGAVPAAMGYGVCLDRAALDAALQHHASPSGQIDEDAAYRHIGLDPARRGRFQHGAAVLGLMAGTPGVPRGGLTPQPQPAAGGLASATADIVFVQLPRDTVQDSSSAGLGACLLDGLRFILDCAAPGQRVVVNISDGSSRGTHDGQGPIERALAALVAGQPAGRLSIVLPAGNTLDEERHAQFDAVSAGPNGVTLQLPPDAEMPAFLVMRVPADASGLELRLTPPGADAQTQPWHRAGTAAGWPDAADPVASVAWPLPRLGQATQVLLAWAPTRVDSARRRPAPHGEWRIEIRATEADILEPVHLYISRNQVNPGALRRGRQARFLDLDGHYDPARTRAGAERDPARTRAGLPPMQWPKAPRLAEGALPSPLRRRGTLNALATGQAEHIEVVGSDYRREAEPTGYSSLGPAAGPSGAARQEPDCSMAVDESRAMPGLRAAGLRSGEVVRVTGTSFAAPQRARELIDAVGAEGT